MKQKIVLVSLLACVALIAAACGQSTTQGTRQTARSNRTQPPRQPEHSHARVPAFQSAVSAASLPPTLPPDNFTGLTRDAYRVVREIPDTIAQLPCYCYCDQSIGHKSLHSCFVDGHASQCAVCVGEALQAYDLKKSGMSPAQIRERIIEQYSRQ